MEEAINNLSSTSACGYDSITSSLVKCGKSSLATILAHIFYLSIRTEVFPRLWKEAKITPLYKSGDHDNPNNYRLPKVHKAGAPLRPIVASRGSIMYGIARRVADILAPLVGKNGYALKNSEDLAKQLGQLHLEDDEILVSFDVTALFTCVPVALSLDIINFTIG